jgi:chromosome segregation ATPase
LNGKQNDIDMLMHAKGELEKAVKTAKQETIDVEKRCDEIYRQLVSTKENLDILTNEQKILSEELTVKQNELLKSERERASKERELLELRPLKNQLKGYSETQKQVIEESTKTDFERNKLQQRVRELETQLTVAKAETQDLSDSFRALVQEKNTLMQQLTSFEQ